MHFIVFDLELNQDFSSIQSSDKEKTKAPFEIIQIGAVKLDLEFNTVGTLNRYVKPTLYTGISPFITELTGITTERLQSGEQFTEVYNDFAEFTAGTDSIFCTWGMSDIKELFSSANRYRLNSKLLPASFINIQPYVSIFFKLPSKRLLRLEHAVKALNLPINCAFHNAFNDAFYTAEILKKVYNPYIRPITYNPEYNIVKNRQPKRVIDVNGLLNQFEKMYNRKMTDEEQGIILLAYKMGKTNQFLK